MTFKEKVYEITRQIPKGEVATYGQVARLAGNPKAARAVGLLMAKNPDAPHTPCHRVVAADGSLHGYSGSGGLSQKMEMLINEGVKFTGDKVNLKKCLWTR
jgi:O-6-methylguanine DNA methyltransferase